MRFASVLVREVGPASGPDLTRYSIVCAASLAALLALAWLFRRYVANHMKLRAAKRSLQVLDVLPLSGKQKLVVVRCYDRSFLLGLGEKEVRAIAELDAAVPVVEPSLLAGPSAVGPSFAARLEDELVPRPAATPGRLAVHPATPVLGSKEGFLA